MIDQTLPQPPVLLNARAQRALELYRSRRHDIEDLGADVYLVPSRTSERLSLPLGTVKGRVRLGLQKLRGHPELRGMALG